MSVYRPSVSTYVRLQKVSSISMKFVCVRQTPVSPVTMSIHTPTRSGPTATAQKYVLIAVQRNTEDIYH